MEFLGPKLTLKIAPKSPRTNSRTTPQKSQQKRAFIEPLPGAHGRAWGRTATRAWWHGRATRHGVAVPLCCWPARFGLAWRTVVRLHARPCLPVFAQCLVLDARDCLEALIFLEFTLEVFFSIKTRRFLLKWRQTQFRHKMNRRKIIWP